ncbi:unnamed protein product [Coccothraustes coccothraustes]
MLRHASDDEEGVTSGRQPCRRNPSAARPGPVLLQPCATGPAPLWGLSSAAQRGLSFSLGQRRPGPAHPQSTTVLGEERRVKAGRRAPGDLGRHLSVSSVTASDLPPALA